MEITLTIKAEPLLLDILTKLALSTTTSTPTAPIPTEETPTTNPASTDALTQAVLGEQKKRGRPAKNPAPPAPEVPKEYPPEATTLPDYDALKSKALGLITEGMKRDMDAGDGLNKNRKAFHDLLKGLDPESDGRISRLKHQFIEEAIEGIKAILQVP